MIMIIIKNNNCDGNCDYNDDYNCDYNYDNNYDYDYNYGHDYHMSFNISIFEMCSQSVLLTSYSAAYDSFFHC